MVLNDQPTIFGDRLVVAVSSVEDGSMNFRGNDSDLIRGNRTYFLGKAGIDPLNATLLQVSFDDGDNFKRYQEVSEDDMGEGILAPDSTVIADAIVTVRPNRALFLPLGDCIGAVIYDPQNQILMLSHLGRHSLEQFGGRGSIEFLVKEYGSQPEDVLIWFSPSVGKTTYPMRQFSGKSLKEVALEQVLMTGVDINKLEVSTVDTAENQNYYSHSQFLTGNPDRNGRFAVVAMML